MIRMSFPLKCYIGDVRQRSIKSKIYFLRCCVALSFLFLFISSSHAENKIVLSTKRIFFEEFPEAHNPSLIAFESGYLLTFRYIPSLYTYPWISHIGVVLLDKSFDPISRPQLLKIRPKCSKTLSQAEDARIFSHKGRLFIIYNDNIEIENPSLSDRRDMFIAELFCVNGFFSVSAPRKLIYEEKYQTQLWQKNWTPFEYKGKLLMTYTVNPHEIINPNLVNGSCYLYDMTIPDLNWDWGTLRGSSPPLLDEGEYIAFFHSGIYISSSASWGSYMWHYYIGAYTFSSEPPFHITKISPFPIVADGFYTFSNYYKRVIFPGGCVISGSYIYLAYGKDDREMWIATLDKKALKRSLVYVESTINQLASND